VNHSYSGRDHDLSAIGSEKADCDELLTEEWLRKVGLWEGAKTAACEPMIRVFAILSEDVGLFGLSLSSVRGTVISTTTALKTIGDARTLCRLLGVPLREALEPGDAGR